MHHHLFGTDGIRGQYGTWPICLDFAAELGLALASHAQLKKKQLAIGRDSRSSGVVLSNCLTTVLSQSGIKILDLGIVATPLLAWFAAENHLPALMISASHNQAADNGYKFLNQYGQKWDDAAEKQLITLLQNPPAALISPSPGEYIDVHHQAISSYIAMLEKIIHPSAKVDRHLVFDGAHGAVSEYAQQAWSKACHWKVTCIHISPNGQNINLDAGTENDHHLIHTIKSLGACAGVAVDGDGDRLIWFDQYGRRFDGDSMLFALFKIYQAKGQHITSVVGTSMSNQGLASALAEENCQFIRAGIGDRKLVQCLTSHQAKLGAEQAGHIVDFHWMISGDGLGCALWFAEQLALLNTDMATLTQNYKPWPQLCHYLNNHQPAQFLKHPKLQVDLHAIRQRHHPHTRLLIRASGTEPLIRIMAEDINQTRARKALTEVVHCLEEYAHELS